MGPLIFSFRYFSYINVADALNLVFGEINTRLFSTESLHTYPKYSSIMAILVELKRRYMSSGQLFKRY